MDITLFKGKKFNIYLHSKLQYIGIGVLNRQELTMKYYFACISFNKPFWYPHKEIVFDEVNSKMSIFGWLFFYFGVSSYK